MRAIVVRSIGGPEVLQLADAPEPAPASGEVLVKIAAVGVNFADTERRRGIYSPPPLPWIPGREAAGVVVAAGPGVDKALAGARVAYFSPRASGSYAELATVPSSALFRFERELPFDQMAALPLQGLTAHGVLRLAAIKPGQTALVLAAAGGVGQILVQLARRAGARVILLDEPTVGVDPQSRERIYDMLDRLRGSGASLLLTTHQLEEAEARCDRIVIIDHGQVRAAGTFEELVAATVGNHRRVAIRLDRALAGPIPGFENGGDSSGAGSAMLRAQVDDVGAELATLLQRAESAGYRIEDVEVRGPSLQAVFLHLTGRELRE